MISFSIHFSYNLKKKKRIEIDEQTYFICTLQQKQKKGMITWIF